MRHKWERLALHFQAGDMIDFATLDDVLLAPFERHTHINRARSTRIISSIGPALEYALQQAPHATVLPHLDELRQSTVIRALKSALDGDDKRDRLSATSLAGRSDDAVGYAPQAPDADAP
jgi:hypothetical protein